MAQVRILANDVEPLTVGLDEFILANCFEAEEEADIRAAIERGEQYLGGGGAAPIWTVERVL